VPCDTCFGSSEQPKSTCNQEADSCLTAQAHLWTHEDAAKPPADHDHHIPHLSIMRAKLQF